VAQGTIKDYEDETKAGSLLLEDGREVSIDADSIGDAAIRTLRLGQRVKFDLVEADGGLVSRDLRLVTFD